MRTFEPIRYETRGSFPRHDPEPDEVHVLSAEEALRIALVNLLAWLAEHRGPITAALGAPDGD